jgi:hypothetical protein
MSLITIVTVIRDFAGTYQQTFLDNFVFPNVFINRPGTIPELMQVITDKITAI